MSENEPNTEVEKAGSEVALPDDPSYVDEVDTEKAVWRAVMWGMVLATPICIVIWMVMVVLAVGPEDPEDWFAWLGIGALVGVLAGAFFGGWAVFTMKAHMLDEVDARHARS